MVGFPALWLDLHGGTGYSMVFSRSIRLFIWLHSNTPVSSLLKKDSASIPTSGYIPANHSARSSRTARRYSSVEEKGRSERSGTDRSKPVVYAINKIPFYDRKVQKWVLSK